MRNLIINRLIKHAADHRIEWAVTNLLWDGEKFQPSPAGWPLDVDGWLDASLVTREWLEERTDEELLGFLDDDACLEYR